MIVIRYNMKKIQTKCFVIQVTINLIHHLEASFENLSTDEELIN